MPTTRDFNLRPYIGIPFEDANCYELFRRLYLELFHIQLPPQPYRGATSAFNRENANLITHEAVKWISVEDGLEQFGDAALCHLGGLPSHIGFVIGGGRMIHAQEKTFSVCESYRTSLDWRDRKKSFYRHPARAVG